MNFRNRMEIEMRLQVSKFWDFKDGLQINKRYQNNILVDYKVLI